MLAIPVITMPLCFDGCGESGSNIVRIHSNIIMILAAMGLILSIAMLTIEGILNINSIKEKTYLIIFSTFSVLYFVILYFSYK